VFVLFDWEWLLFIQGESIATWRDGYPFSTGENQLVQIYL